MNLFVFVRICVCACVLRKPRDPEARSVTAEDFFRANFVVNCRRIRQPGRLMSPPCDRCSPVYRALSLTSFLNERLFSRLGIDPATDIRHLIKALLLSSHFRTSTVLLSRFGIVVLVMRFLSAEHGRPLDPPCLRYNLRRPTGRLTRNLVERFCLGIFHAVSVSNTIRHHHPHIHPPKPRGHPFTTPTRRGRVGVSSGGRVRIGERGCQLHVNVHTEN